MGLVLTTVFAYPDEWIYYIIAYNIGIFGFMIAEHFQGLNLKMFDELGKIGFTFFLGANTPMLILERYVDFHTSVGLVVVGYIAKFSLAIVYSYFITRFVERPLIKWGKTMEKNLKQSESD